MRPRRSTPALDTGEPPEVELDDITTILGGSAVLHRLRLHVPAGKVTVLMGPSGVGKTTMIKHVLGLLEPDAGTVRIDGRDVWDASPEEWQRIHRRQGAMLGGHTLYTTSVFASMTALENLTYTLHALGVPESQRRERAMARLREVHLADQADRLPEQLPSHAAKRLALARALVADAPLTILDEIDIGLDSEHQPAMLAAVRSLRERTGCTLLITTHTLELARTLADHLAILVNGRIVAAGPPEEILAGVETTEDFDRRFEFSEFVGPPRLEDAEAAALQRRHRPPGAGPESLQHPPARPADRPMNLRQVWVAVLVVLLVIAAVLALKVYTSGSFVLF
ncbi:ATP-binding cassette domain-containing protein [Pseudonocardia acaciae]|uniref:ATP-binding cassette domain-containing protein n=1 Tax=Pseudonocardia acaciae TaxID=551276 RepID=UPI00048E0BC8|nr:ATP-binding cassette domain-containing protein [Pseudonocardia acaciae]